MRKVGIFKQSAGSQSLVLVQLAETRFDSVEWNASFEEDKMKEEILMEVYSNGVLKVRPGQSLLDTSDSCSAKKNCVRCVSSITWVSEISTESFRFKRYGSEVYKRVNRRTKREAAEKSET